MGNTLQAVPVLSRSPAVVSSAPYGCVERKSLIEIICLTGSQTKIFSIEIMHVMVGLLVMVVELTNLRGNLSNLPPLETVFSEQNFGLVSAVSGLVIWCTCQGWCGAAAGTSIV